MEAVLVYEADENGDVLVSSAVEDAITEWVRHPDGTMTLAAFIYLD